LSFRQRRNRNKLDQNNEIPRATEGQNKDINAYLNDIDPQVNVQIISSVKLALWSVANQFKPLIVDIVNFNGIIF